MSDFEEDIVDRACAHYYNLYGPTETTIDEMVICFWNDYFEGRNLYG